MSVSEKMPHVSYTADVERLGLVGYNLTLTCQSYFSSVSRSRLFLSRKRTIVIIVLF